MINVTINRAFTGLNVLLISTALLTADLSAQVNSTQPEVKPPALISTVVLDSNGDPAVGALVFNTFRKIDGIKTIGATVKSDGSLEIHADDQVQVRTDKRGMFQRASGHAYFFINDAGTEFAFAPPEFAGDIRLRPGGKLMIAPAKYKNLNQNVGVVINWNNCLAGNFPKFSPKVNPKLDWRIFSFFNLSIGINPADWNLEKPLEIVVPPGEVSASSITEQQIRQLSEHFSVSDKQQSPVWQIPGLQPVMGIHMIKSGETTTVPLKFGVCLSGKIKGVSKRSTLPDWPGSLKETGYLSLYPQWYAFDSDIRNIWERSEETDDIVEALQSSNGKSYRQRASTSFVLVNNEGEFLSMPLPSDEYHASMHLEKIGENSTKSSRHGILLSSGQKNRQGNYRIKMREYGSTDLEVGSRTSDVEAVGIMDVGTLFYSLDDRPEQSTQSQEQVNRSFTAGNSGHTLSAAPNVERKSAFKDAAGESTMIEASLIQLKSTQPNTNAYSITMGKLHSALVEEFMLDVRKREAELVELEQLLVKTRRAVTERERDYIKFVDRQLIQLLNKHNLPSRVIQSSSAQPSQTQPKPVSVNPPDHDPNEYAIKLHPIVAKFTDSGERYCLLSAKLVFAKDDARTAADWFKKNSPWVHLQIQDSLSQLVVPTELEMQKLEKIFNDPKTEIEKVLGKNAGVDVELRVSRLHVQ